MGIVRPVMEAFPWAWAFFIPFIMSTTFTVLNLFIGIIVSAMQAEHEQDAADDRSQLHDDQKAILSEMRLMRGRTAGIARGSPAEILNRFQRVGINATHSAHFNPFIGFDGLNGKTHRRYQ